MCHHPLWLPDCLVRWLKAQRARQGKFSSKLQSLVRRSTTKQQQAQQSFLWVRLDLIIILCVLTQISIAFTGWCCSPALSQPASQPLNWHRIYTHCWWSSIITPVESPPRTAATAWLSNVPYSAVESNLNMLSQAQQCTSTVLARPRRQHRLVGSTGVSEKSQDVHCQQ